MPGPTRKRSVLAVIASLTLLGGALLGAPASTSARPALGPFELDGPGVSLQKPATLLVGARLRNAGNVRAVKVVIESARLATAPLLRVAPRGVARIAPEQSAVVQANFRSTGLVNGKRYRLVVRGTYGRTVGARQPFVVTTSVVIPPKAPG